MSRVGLSIGAVLVLALVGVGNCLAATTDQVERRTSMCQIVKAKPSVGDLWIRLRAVYISDVTEGTVLKDPHCPRQRLELGKPLTETEDKSVVALEDAVRGDVINDPKLRMFVVDISGVYKRGRESSPGTMSISKVWSFRRIHGDWMKANVPQ